MGEFSSHTSQELLSIHGRISEELRERGVTRSSNNPTGDLAEYFFCKAFGWKQLPNSNSNIDATDERGARFQIKGRRMTRHNESRQLSAIRDLSGEHFDFIAAVLFLEDYRILRAGIIPYQIVLDRSTFVSRTNSHKFILSDEIWGIPGVRDVTGDLCAVIL